MMKNNKVSVSLNTIAALSVSYFSLTAAFASGANEIDTLTGPSTTTRHAMQRPEDFLCKSLIGSFVKTHDQTANPYSKRAQLIEQYSESTQKEGSLLQRVNELSRKQHELDEKVKKAMTKVSHSQDKKTIIDAFSDSESLINRLTPEHAQKMARLSADVYRGDEVNEQLAKEMKSFAPTIDPKFQTNITEISALRNFLTSIEEDSKKGKFNFKQYKGKIDNLDQSILSGKNIKDVAGIIQAINEKISLLGNENLVLSGKTVKSQQTQACIKLQQMIGHSKAELEVKGVFYRNNGEFSGYAAYDHKEKKLVLVFAGSKSKLDWLKDGAGWNYQLSPRINALAGVNLHYGFGTFVEELSDEAFERATEIMQELNVTQIETTGHSLGGALAMIFGAIAKERAEKKGLNVKVSALTFGAPNIVNANSLDAFHKLYGNAGNVVRIEDSKDPVPKLCFWKTSPGITLSYVVGWFSDGAGKSSWFLRANHHACGDYYHSAESGVRTWLDSVKGMKHAILESAEHSKLLKSAKAEWQNAGKAISTNMRNIMDVDAAIYSFVKESPEAAEQQRQEALKVVARHKSEAEISFKKDQKDAKSKTLAAKEEALAKLQKQKKKHGLYKLIEDAFSCFKPKKRYDKESEEIDSEIDGIQLDD